MHGSREGYSNHFWRDICPRSCIMIFLPQKSLGELKQSSGSLVIVWNSARTYIFVLSAFLSRLFILSTLNQEGTICALHRAGKGFVKYRCYMALPCRGRPTHLLRHTGMCHTNGSHFSQRIHRRGPFHENCEKIVKSAFFEAEKPLKVGPNLRKFRKTVKFAMKREKNP